MSKALCCIVLVLGYSIGCLGVRDAMGIDGDSGPCCPQEMCVFVFDQLEEQAQRWNTVVEALRRTVTLLSSINDDRLASLSVALKADPLISSLVIQPTESNDVPLTPDWDVEPVSLVGQFKSKHVIKKRAVTSGGGKVLSPRERVLAALKWAKTVDGSLATVSRSTREKPLSTGEEMPEISEPTNGTIAIATADFPQFDGTVDDETGTTSKVTSSRDKVGTSEEDSANRVTTALGAGPTTSLQSPTKQGAFASHQYVKEMVENLQSSMKCAIAQLVSPNDVETLGTVGEPRATLNSNDTLTVQFELRTCQRHLTSVWMHISDRKEPLYARQRSSLSGEDPASFLQIPNECWTRTNNTYSITLPSSGETCAFPLIALRQCRLYSIELLPIYSNIQGQPAQTDITVPPADQSDWKNLKSLAVRSLSERENGIEITWSIQSEECALLLTSVGVRIYQDASMDSLVNSFTIPSNCIRGRFDNSFSSTLTNAVDAACGGVSWKPLDLCRDYMLELEPQYTSTLKGSSSSVEFFTAGKDQNNCCNMLSLPFGVFYSNNYNGKFDCSWLISAEKNETIWLTFTEFQIEGYYYHVKVFDGPYSSSRLMLDHYGYQPPQPLRSSSNRLYVQLAHQYYGESSYGKHFMAYYASVAQSKYPYVAGCGGLIVDNGLIAKPSDPSTDENASECSWYLFTADSSKSFVIESSEGMKTFPMIAYDGWTDEDGKMALNQTKDSGYRAVAFSRSNKAFIKFPSWNSVDVGRSYSWKIQTTRNRNECSYNLEMASSGTIKSPNYPSAYSELLDCRWVISVNETSKIRLTFAQFNTQQYFDFVSIYDGPTVYSPLLSELSGEKATPLMITSSTHQMVIRFNTYSRNNNQQYDYYNNRWYGGWNSNGGQNGFLAIFSAVSCDQ